SDLRSIGSGDYSATENRYSGESVPSNDLLRSWAKGEGINDTVFDLIVRESVSQGVDPRVALSVAIAESNGNQDEISEAGAIGVMQLMPETAQSLGVDPYDLEQNIHGGVKYLKQNLDAFDGDVTLAAAGYNAGTGAVQKFGGVPPYSETQNYANRVSNLFGEAANLVGDKYSYDYGGGLRGNADDDETRSGNIFGTENYDMPLWGNPNVSSLKTGWAEVIPQIGGVLKSMGFDPVITSGGRTHEHQMSINPSAPNSYHIIQDDGGDAIDISLAEGGVTEEQAQKVLDYFKSTGLFAEVLYHDAGSGLHLHLGGLNTDALSKMPARTVNRGQVTGNVDDTSTEAETSTDTNSIYQRLIADILNEDTKPIFDATGDDETTRNILSAFAADKRDGASGNDFITLSSMFDAEGNFDNTKANRKTLAELYGDDLAEFGQAALDERLAQLADKNSSVENLTVDDRKLLSGVLKAKLNEAGTKVGGHFLKRLNEGDADTFSKALGSLGSVKQTALPENLSTEIARLRDEIKTLSDKATQTSDKAERADIFKQIKTHDAQINSIQTLGKDIAKLEADLQKASDNFV
ncbi:MAG: transglycosylase SLT domain-containing protein, partial [Selenomonadaceae bacterium]|nr:transglycosylase SLT domain-containing protein [Selenomonadaceae bacterium]